MIETRSIAVTVLIDTAEPMLFPENLDVSTIDAVQLVRRLVIEALPGGLRRVVSVMHPSVSLLMHRAHVDAMTAHGMADMIARPPDDYRGPGDEP